MLELPARHSDRTWPATLAIFLLITGYVGGLRLWDQLTPGTRPLTATQTLEVGAARFEPAPGWLMDVSRSRSGDSLVLFKDGHHFVVKTSRWLGGEQGPLQMQQRLIVRRDRMRIEGQVSRFFTTWGLQGSTFSYYGPQTSGRFWQVVDRSLSMVVTVDFYGPNEDGSQAAKALADAQRMLDSMDLGAS